MVGDRGMYCIWRGGLVGWRHARTVGVAGHVEGLVLVVRVVVAENEHAGAAAVGVAFGHVIPGYTCVF